MTYQMWVEQEAKRLKSDGCSWVSELFHYCCLEHDLGYRTGGDARQAFRFYRLGFKDYWGRSKATSRAEIDRRFWRCMAAHSVLGRYSPIAYVRWLGVRMFGRWAWKH